MKKRLLGLLLAFLAVSLLPSCGIFNSRKSGCPATESLKAQEKKGGGYKKSGKTKSGLFPDKAKKKTGLRH